MPEKTYGLNTILQTIFSYKNNKVKKRIIYDKSPLGGFSSKWTKILFYILPFFLSFFKTSSNGRLVSFLRCSKAVRSMESSAKENLIAS